MSKGTVGVVIGGLVGAAAGFAAGIMLAPRSGSESRAIAADAMNDAWDSAVDTYQQGAQVVSDKVGNLTPNVNATTDELRAKVDLARERMDQLRESLAAASAAEADTTSVDSTVEQPASASAEESTSTEE